MLPILSKSGMDSEQQQAGNTGEGGDAAGMKECIASKRTVWGKLPGVDANKRYMNN